MEAEDLGSLLSKTISSVDNAANVSNLLIVSRDCRQKQTLFTVLPLVLLYCISRLRLVDFSLIVTITYYNCLLDAASNVLQFISLHKIPQDLYRLSRHLFNLSYSVFQL